ncbi:hypothetical protein WJX77_008526 [Trebouxia sp. C0004]
MFHGSTWRDATFGSDPVAVPPDTLTRPHLLNGRLSALAADLFIVITVRLCWPIACLWQQKQLLELAKVFCYSQLGFKVLSSKHLRICSWYAVLHSTEPELSIQRIRPNSRPDTASRRRINMPQMPVSVQLLAGLTPKDASMFAL